MKVLVVGASSFIGLRLYGQLRDDPDMDVVGTYFEHQKDPGFLHLDITDPEELEQVLAQVRPEAVYWVAGSKNLKKCEADPEYARRINTYPVMELLRILAQLGLRPHVVFVSTDYVFDGERGRYAAGDAPRPKTQYGQSNLWAEQCLQASPFPCSIVRTSAVMGRHGTFFDWLTHALGQNQPIDLFADVYFSPTPIGRLVMCFQRIVAQRRLGILHVCGNQRLSRYEFAIALKALRPRFVAELVPAAADASQLLFQKDLSLVPSDVCQPFANLTIFEELAGEL